MIPMLRIPNRQNPRPLLYHTKFSVLKIPTREKQRMIHCQKSQKTFNIIYIQEHPKCQVNERFYPQIAAYFPPRIL